MFSIKTALTSVFIVIALKQLINTISAQRRHATLLNNAKRKRKERDTKISQEFTPTTQLPEDIIILILNSTITDLLNLLNQDKITSEQILRVYHNRAITIGLKLELIAESNFPEALALAKQCDETRKNTPKEERHKLGNLFGIPLCIKDSFEQKDLDSTCGLAKNCFHPCSQDGGIITILKSKGAIPFIRANVSQALRAFDCFNNIWGRGLNPWSLERTVGGSSGGDGGLVAAKCSPIGFGSDLYGSIRLPAGFNGICGFKGTGGRYSAPGHTLISPQDVMKFPFLAPSTGPLGRCVEDLKLFVKELIRPESRMLDPSSAYIPWNEEKYQAQGKLKIGYVVSEDFFGASKPCRRAVREAARALENLGHEVVEIKIPDFEEMVLGVITLLAAEGNGRSLNDALAGEKPTSDLELLRNIGMWQNLFKRLAKAFTSKRIGSILAHTIERSPNELILEISKLSMIKGKFLEDWVKQGLDAVISPVTALPALKHGYGGKLLMSSCYLWPANVANLPAGVVSVTKVRSEEAVYGIEDSVYQDVLFKYSQECMEGSCGLPVGVQVMSLPWEDEKCLAVMKAIEGQVKFDELPELN